MQRKALHLPRYERRVKRRDQAVAVIGRIAFDTVGHRLPVKRDDKAGVSLKLHQAVHGALRGLETAHDLARFLGVSIRNRAKDFTSARRPTASRNSRMKGVAMPRALWAPAWRISSIRAGCAIKSS